MAASKTTTSNGLTLSSFTEDSTKADDRKALMDSSAAFLLLSIKGMATDESIPKTEASSLPEEQDVVAKVSYKAEPVRINKGPIVSNPSTPIHTSKTTRPLHQKPILPRVPSVTSLLLPPVQVPTTMSQAISMGAAFTSGPATTALSANITSPSTTTVEHQQPNPLWLLPRRTVSLGSSSENLAGLLQDALKRQEALQNLAAGTESPITTESSISSMSASSCSTDSNQDSMAMTAFLPGLVSPTVGPDSLKKHVSVAAFTEVPLLPAIPFIKDSSKGAGPAMKTVVIPTSPPLQSDEATSCPTSPTPSTAEEAVTVAAAPSIPTVSLVATGDGVLRRKFSWKSYPVLEQYLLDHRIEYLSYSAKLNYTAEQKRYNNTLTTNLIELAGQHGLTFDKEHFSFAAIRDRIRCYYKSYVQAAKKKKRKQLQAASASNKNNNSSSGPNKRRKKTKAKTPVTPTKPPQLERQVLHGFQITEAV